MFAIYFLRVKKIKKHIGVMLTYTLRLFFIFLTQRRAYALLSSTRGGEWKKHRTNAQSYELGIAQNKKR